MIASFSALVYFLLDQIFGGGREIIEDVLLLRQVAGLVPFLAELAPAADVGHDVDAAAIEPKPAGEIEIAASC